MQTKYVVIEMAGTENERDVYPASTYSDALTWRAVNYVDDEIKRLMVEIVQELPNGNRSFECSKSSASQNRLQGQQGSKHATGYMGMDWPSGRRLQCQGRCLRSKWKIFPASDWEWLKGFIETGCIALSSSTVYHLA